jgi:N-acetyl sugar amidotransferase
MTNHTVCKICLIDNISYKYTKFNYKGICDYCINFEKNTKKTLTNNLKYSQKYKDNLLKKLISSKHKNKVDYDCLIGVSGGVDSSYLVYYAVEKLNLKPILYHVDVGWNNRIAVSNIEKIIDKYDLDLQTDVIDWNEIKDLTRSFLFAQVPYMETIQDHAIWASMHNFAKKTKIKNILTGGNLQTESYRPPLYIAYYAGDLTLINDIQKKFGTIKLNKYPRLDILEYKILYKFFYGIKIHQPLNYIHYNKNEAMKTLSQKFGWENYGGKHYESNYTKFFDAYWKNYKFNHDPRKGQLSSLISTNQISREEALTELSKSTYNDENIKKDIKYICNKLDFSTDELQKLFEGSNKYYYDYKSKYLILKFITFLLKFFKKEDRNIK